MIYLSCFAIGIMASILLIHGAFIVSAKLQKAGSVTLISELIFNAA